MILQFEQEAEGVFDLSHGVRWKLAKLSFQVRFDEGANPLHVDHGGLVEKREATCRHFVPAPTLLRGERHVNNECTRCFGVIARDHEDGTQLGTPRSNG